jgi:hypothetical protein
VTAGTCRYCECTETAPCAGGCAWTDETLTLCTVCAEVVETARELVHVLHITAADAAAPLRVGVASFNTLTVAEQRTLVTICRALVDNVREGIAAAISEEAVEAIRQVDAIGAFLLQHCPDQVGDDDTAADVVLRILDRNLGSRLVLPGGRG